MASFFASASRPYGMVNLSPDTDIQGDWKSSYLYHASSIRGFSHTHAWQLAGVPVLPTTGPKRGTEGSEAYRSKFSHDSEIVGQPLDRPWFLHSQLAQGGTLELELGPEPNLAWGANADAAPP